MNFAFYIRHKTVLPIADNEMRPTTRNEMIINSKKCLTRTALGPRIDKSVKDSAQ